MASSAPITVTPQLPEAQLHLLPCAITYNGPANVDQFFHPKPAGIKNDELEVEEAALRGRKLLGARVALPEVYLGLVCSCPKPLSPAKRPPGGAAARGGKSWSSAGSGNSSSSGSTSGEGWVAEATFRDFAYWNHDTAPTAVDEVNRCISWLHLAQQLHAPISSATVDLAMKEEGVGTGDALAGTKRKPGT